MESEGSLPCSQKSVTGHWAKPEESSSLLKTYLSKVYLNITLPPIYIYASQVDYFQVCQLKFYTNLSLPPPRIRDTSSVPLLSLDLIILITFGEEWNEHKRIPETSVQW